MKQFIKLAAPFVLALIAVPASAQSEKEEIAKAQDFAATLQDVFVAEPLTAEQEARLPVASQIVARVIPDGTYARMMDDVIDQMLAPMMGMMPNTMPAGEIAAILGVDRDQLASLEPVQLGRLSSILDPQYAQRGEVGMRFMMDEMTSVFGEMEPALRGGMARAYAVRFDDAQLAKIAAFFSTPTGATYAAESFVVMADPQVMSASMEMVPVMLERMPQIIDGMEERIAQLPHARGFMEMSAGERAEVAQLLGLTQDELETAMQSQK